MKEPTIEEILRRQDRCRTIHRERTATRDYLRHQFTERIMYSREDKVKSDPDKLYDALMAVRKARILLEKAESFLEGFEVAVKVCFDEPED